MNKRYFCTMMAQAMLLGTFVTASAQTPENTESIIENMPPQQECSLPSEQSDTTPKTKKETKDKTKKGKENKKKTGKEKQGRIVPMDVKQQILNSTGNSGSIHDPDRNQNPATPQGSQPTRNEAEGEYRIGVINLPDDVPQSNETTQSNTRRQENQRNSQEQNLAKAIKLLDTELYETGLKKIRDLANSGYAPAINQLGDMYRYGKGTIINKDIHKAIDYYKDAARRGNVAAACSLGFIYLSGETGPETPQTIADGLRYLEQAAIGGDAVALYNLGYIYENGLYGNNKDDRKAAINYKKAADKGDYDAICALGIFYQDGRGGLSKDYDESFKYLKKAADNNIAEAYGYLGKAYLEGLGTQRNPVIAQTYIDKGIAGNDPLSIYLKGKCYENGLGVAKDVKKAKQLYSKAYNLGYEPAFDAL